MRCDPNRSDRSRIGSDRGTMDHPEVCDMDRFDLAITVALCVAVVSLCGPSLAFLFL